MKDVKVKKPELLERLKANRAAHRAVFEEALEGYKAEVVRILEKRLADARKGKQIDHNLRLVEPMDQTRDYDRAITMIEMSVDEEIVLTEADFSSYVMDDWSWKQQFTASNTRYLNKD